MCANWCQYSLVSRHTPAARLLIFLETAPTVVPSFIKRVSAAADETNNTTALRYLLGSPEIKEIYLILHLLDGKFT